MQTAIKSATQFCTTALFDYVGKGVKVRVF